MRKAWFEAAAWFLAVMVLISSFGTVAWATTAEEKKKEAETNLDNVNQNISSMEEEKNTTQNEVNALGTQLTDLLVSMEVLELDLQSKEIQLENVGKDLAAAKEQEASQYDAMKKRIKYLYEKGDSDIMTALLGARSISDFLNKMEYATSLYEYDKNMLTAYRQVRQTTQDLQARVEQEKSELEGMQREYAYQEEQLNTLIAQKRSEVEDFDAQLAKAKEEAARYQQEIQEQNEIIRAEAQRREEQARIAAAAQLQALRQAAANGAASSNGTGSGGESSGNGDETGAVGGENVPYNASLGSEIVSYACQFIGNPYVWGGTSLTNGADCSGFVQQVFAHFGISLPRVAEQQRYSGTEVGYANAQPGDIIYYSGHIAIYMGGGQIVHASSSDPYPVGGIKTSSATYRTILAVRRLAQ